MGFRSTPTMLRYALFVFTVLPTLTHGQTAPWDVFEDPASPSVCDVINAANAELVVLHDTGQLVLITGTDVPLVDTILDEFDQVFFEGVPAGLISFQEDGDGFRTLWWTGLTGQVVDVDPFTGEPTATTLLPSDFFDVPCDACDFWDDQSVCVIECFTDADCFDGNVCTDDVCDDGECLYFTNISSCDDGLFCTLVDACIDGVCAGIGDTCPGQTCNEILEFCVDRPSVPVVLNFCGSNMALAMSLTLAGLAATRLVTHRRPKRDSRASGFRMSN